jgi:murein DD-endopeptidase MepM/ murein hydrolase activator NlpD
LWESLLSQGASPELVVHFADIFSWTFDFLTECRRGDRFEFLVEAQLREGEFYRFGPILVARYEGARGSVAGVRYEPEGEKVSYYAPDGTSLRKIFLRSPLNYRRISSGFTYRRFHPILKRYRPHLGIDYVAPIGTPVVSVGDGVVTFVGWNGGFGNYVEVKHGRSYTTSYGHLSRFRRGLRKGERLAQGEVVGYVGSTGMSTGPHLDFRMKRGGKAVNPLAVNIPSADPVPMSCRRDFYHAARVSLAALDLLPPTGTEGKSDLFTTAFLAGAQSGLFPLGPEGGDRPVP